MELVNLEVTSNLRVGDQPEGAQIQPPTTVQPTKDITGQQAEDVALLLPKDSSA